MGEQPWVATDGDGVAVTVSAVPSLADLDLGHGSAYRRPEWPLPSDVKGSVWIQDSRFELSSRIDGLFELTGSGELGAVERWEGLAITAYWMGSSPDRSHWSPSLAFSTLSGAIAWARSVASDITVRLVETDPRGTYRERAEARLDPELTAKWDRTQAS